MFIIIFIAYSCILRIQICHPYLRQRILIFLAPAKENPLALPTFGLLFECRRSFSALLPRHLHLLLVLLLVLPILAIELARHQTHIAPFRPYPLHLYNGRKLIQNRNYNRFFVLVTMNRKSNTNTFVRISECIIAQEASTTAEADIYFGTS